MTTSAIVTENPGKRFGKLWAARDISFEVKLGEVVGFIGQNGAGKTTVMRMITSLLRPTAGRVHIQGRQADRPGGSALGLEGIARGNPSRRAGVRPEAV